MQALFVLGGWVQRNRMGVAAEGNFLEKVVSKLTAEGTWAGQQGRGVRFASSSLVCIYYYVYI